MKTVDVIILLRTRLALSARALSLLIGFSESYVWLVQTGRRKPSVKMCKQLSACAQKFLGEKIRLDDMLGDDT